MTQYDETFPFPMAFGPMVLSEIVAQVLTEHGKTMFRTAETEKYAHVTYFFNGGVETPYPGEERLLVPSQKVATYDLMPEMSAPGVTDVLCNAIEAGGSEEHTSEIQSPLHLVFPLLLGKKKKRKIVNTAEQLSKAQVCSAYSMSAR